MNPGLKGYATDQKQCGRKKLEIVAEKQKVETLRLALKKIPVDRKIPGRNKPRHMAMNKLKAAESRLRKN